MFKDNLPIPLSLSGKYSDSFLMLSSENSVAKLSNRNFLLLGWIGARIVLFSLKFMVMIKDFCRCSVCYLLLCSSSLTEKIGQTGTFRAGAGCKYRSSAHCCYSQHLVLVSKNWEHLYFDPYLAIWGNSVCTVTVWRKKLVSARLSRTTYATRLNEKVLRDRPTPSTQKLIVAVPNPTYPRSGCNFAVDGLKVALLSAVQGLQADGWCDPTHFWP